MSSKKKVSDTTAKSKPALIPKLRFPEFCVAQGWETTILGDHTAKTDTRNKGGKSYPVYSINNEIGFTPQSEQFEGVDSEKRGYDIAQYKLIESRTFAYNPARINVGSLGYSGELNNIIVSSLYVCFQSKPDTDDEFLLHFFKTSGFKRSVNNHVEGGIRSYLFYENFARIEIPLPSFKEQQKIASCLSSLDRIITAHTQKLNALKTHKKGLMQQLFPREGETVPRLRFPEFQGYGEWVTRSFASLFECKPNNTFSRDQLNYDNGPARNIHYGDIHTKYSTMFRIQEEMVPYVNASASLSKLKPEAYCKEGDLVFADASEDLADVGKSIELVDLCGERVLAGSHTILARQKGNALKVGFTGYLFKGRGIRAQIEKEAQGTKVLQISASRIANMIVIYPENKEEQQSIASCLTSLDNLISAQAKMLEVLKTHKKGLMQGLFPATDR